MSVDLRPGESQEALLKRFRKEVVKGRILSTYRKKRWFVSKSENRRLAKQRAARKARRKAMAASRRFNQSGRGNNNNNRSNYRTRRS